MRTLAKMPAPLRLVQLAAAALLAIGLGGIALTSGAGADTRDTTTSSTTTTIAADNPNTFSLSAQANALDVVVTDPNLPLSGLLAIEAGPYGSSASLNSLGQSLADAGAPYSPSVYSLVGTVNGLGAGVLPPLPPLPGYVSATYPSTPTDDQTQGGYQITSTTSTSEAMGAVKIGVQPTGSDNATMSASADTKSNGDGSVTLSASAGLDALSFGQLFDIGNVSSSLSMTQQANGQPTVTSTTNLGTVTLLGKVTGLLTNGVGLLGLNVPIDLSGEVIGTLNTLLAKTGVKLAYLPEKFGYTDGTSSTGSSPDSSKTLQSVDSGALQITVTENVPSQGPVSVRFTVGRSYLSTTDVPGYGATPGGTGDTGTLGTTDLGLGGITSSPSALAPLGNPLPSSGTTATPPAPGSTSRPLAEQPVYTLEKGPSAESLYLVLMLVALAVLLGSQAIRIFSVRLALNGRRAA